MLEQARSLDEAIDLIKRRPVLVPDLYLIADGHSGETAVVERSPTRAEVRRSRDILAVANHALTPAFASDKESQRLRDYIQRKNRTDVLFRAAELARIPALWATFDRATGKLTGETFTWRSEAEAAALQGPIAVDALPQLIAVALDDRGVARETESAPHHNEHLCRSR